MVVFCMQKLHEQRHWMLRHCLSALVLFLLEVGVVVAQSQTERPDSATFAVVGERVITQFEYDSALKMRLRQKFFHGNISPEDLKRFSQEVGWALIDRVLLLQEAARRGVQVDKQDLAAKRQSSSEVTLRSDVALQEDSQITVLETLVRKVPTPGDAEVLQFYTTFPEKFTLPEQLDLSLLLINVPPYAKADEWQGAYDRAVNLVEQMRKGGDFGALAMQYSQHESAKAGGELGLLHKGMLADEVQQQLDALSAGHISDPVRLLQGIAIFRLNKRVAQTVISFERARTRARSLLTREKEAQVWQGFIQELRQKKPITINWPVL